MAEPTPEELFDLGVKSIEAKDYIQAKKYFEKACDLKYGGGCGTLGMLYDDGKGVEKNLIKAAQLYSKACGLKDGDGCFNLGRLIMEKEWKKTLKKLLFCLKKLAI